MTTFGELLQSHRQRAGLAQNALARISGVNVGTVNRLERGQRMPASPEQVLQLAEALRLSPGETDSLLRAAKFTANERIVATRRRWRRWARREAV